MIDIEITKQKIINFLNQKGPALPIQISKQIEMTPMFTSAILSELTDVKKIKISSLKVGSSPLYLLPGQEQQLEKFLDNLQGVEKEALLKLQKNKILEDKRETPPIRVALRNIKDFAISFKIQDQLFWKYSFLEEDEFQNLANKLSPRIKQAIPIKISPPEPPTRKPTPPNTYQISEKPNMDEHTSTNQPPTKLEPIFEKSKPAPKTTQTKPKKTNQNFLEEIKPFLEKNQIQILELEEVNKRKVLARVYIHSQPHLLAAFNKKRITELDLIKTYRKAAELNIPYYILTKGDPTKKMQELSEAYKKLRGIGKLE